MKAVISLFYTSKWKPYSKRLESIHKSLTNRPYIVVRFVCLAKWRSVIPRTHQATTVRQFPSHDDYIRDDFHCRDDWPPSWPVMQDSDHTARIGCWSKWRRCRRLGTTDFAKCPDKSDRHCKCWDETFSL